MAKNVLANAGDVGSIPESGISPGVGNSNPLQHSHLENPTDRGAWRAMVHGVTESGMTEHTHHTVITKLLILKLSLYGSDFLCGLNFSKI